MRTFAWISRNFSGDEGLKSFSRVITEDSSRISFFSLWNLVWSRRCCCCCDPFQGFVTRGRARSRNVFIAKDVDVTTPLSLSLSLRAFSKSKGSPKARRTRPALRHFERWVFPTSIVIRGRKSLPVMRFIGSMSMPWKLAVGELEKIGIKKIQFPTFPNFLLSLSLLYISMYSPKDKRTGYRIARVMVIRKKGIASGNK